jgi:hypothetical protein
MKELSVFSLHFTGTFSTAEIYFTPEGMNALTGVPHLRVLMTIYLGHY